MRVRTGRFTRVEHTIISSVAMSLHPQIADRNEPLATKPLIRHPGLSCQSPRRMPVAFATERGEDRLATTRSQSEQVTDLRARPAPLFPVTHADTPSDPLVDLGNRSVVVRDAVVVHPTTNVFGEFSKPSIHRYAPAAARQSTDPVLERLKRFIGPTKLGSVEGESEEHYFVSAAHAALRLIDLQL